MKSVTSILSLFLLIIIAVSFSSFIHEKKKTAKRGTVKWAVEKSSTLKILGASNVNVFTCDMIGYTKRDTIFYADESADSKAIALRGSLEIDINKFNCHHKILTNDLRKTLKAAAYPILFIRFISLERAPDLRDNKDNLKGIVEIEMAGQCRRFEVPYVFTKKGDLIELNGNRSFSFSEFNLKAPHKFGGLVKVKEKFNVDFNLLLNPVQ